MLLRTIKIFMMQDNFWGRLMKKMNNKPFLWLLYSIYCSVPIGCYIWYLYFCIKEESVVQKLATLTNNYPWLWGVYIVVLGIPVIFVLYLCCKPSSSTSQIEEKEEILQAAQTKKTDDSIENDVEEEEIEKTGAEAENYENSDREKDSGPDTDEEENKNHSSKGGSGDGARKRNVRKE